MLPKPAFLSTTRPYCKCWGSPGLAKDFCETLRWFAAKRFMFHPTIWNTHTACGGTRGSLDDFCLDGSWRRGGFKKLGRPHSPNFCSLKMVHGLERNPSSFIGVSILIAKKKSGRFSMWNGLASRIPEASSAICWVGYADCRYNLHDFTSLLPSKHIPYKHCEVENSSKPLNPW